MPQSTASELSAILGVDASYFRPTKQVRSHIMANITPATWYKFRGPELVDADREFVFLIRRLGNFVNELETVTGNRAAGWRELFDAIQNEMDRQAPPRQQGRQAARIFRESRGLNRGANGIGEVFRGNLRSMGVLVIETPVPESRVEGCTFYVGAHPSDRPCVFANTHHLTWFRRNVVLTHELAHAIFDAPSAGASIDLQDGTSARDLSEERADAFAQEVLVPKEVLRHIAQGCGIKWDRIRAQDLARLVAETHVEKRAVLEAALESEFISHSDFESYCAMNITDELKSISERALTTSEFIQKIGTDALRRICIGKRNTTTTDRSIRLPVPYIGAVVNAYASGEISRGKAAELLMIDEETFTDRFEEACAVVQDD
ncbi:MAG: ImmA/IrrE family metallo-endopeptidase [Terriglobia bacterium]